jgi:hypothetical protein
MHKMIKGDAKVLPASGAGSKERGTEGWQLKLYF